MTLSRRTLLQSGSLSLAAAAWVREVRATAPGTTNQPKVIFVTQGGGASQFETFDPKPDAPIEYRGDFAAIGTRLPGVAFCELLPRLATLADRLAVLRSIHHEQASHIAEHIVETGYDLKKLNRTLQGDMPSMGSIVSRTHGDSPSGIPAYVSLPRHHAYSGPHWLGPQHHFFAVDTDPNAADFSVPNLSLIDKMTAERLQDRRQLHAALSRHADGAARDAPLLRFADQAFDLVTGEAARRAFDIAAESPSTRDRYGRHSLGQRMLLARRLVEADVPFVVVRMFDWDDHADLPKNIRPRAEMFDTALSALIEDLAERGLSRDVLVVAMGEFGRTPRVNVNRGRDHFPVANSVLLSGGSYAMGQVIGATDARGTVVTQAPYRPQNVLGMVYRHLGIDPGLTFNDFTGRPRHVLEEREVIKELV